MMDIVLASLNASKQEHILSEISDFSEGHPVYQQLLKFNIEESVKRFEMAMKAETLNVLSEATPISPISNAVVWNDQTKERKQQLADVGWRAIAEGKVAAVIMSGGQGTRLGFAGPKGCYNLSLPSGKTIFQLHIERILKVRQLSAAYMKRITGNATLPCVPVFIMTSDLNDAIIRAFFREHNYFGYPVADIFFFEQGLEPCFTLEGKVILESRTALSMAPDGNGGLYSALSTTGALNNMLEKGVEHLHIYGIDNILTRSIDPGFIGASIESNVQVANKVVWRANKGEKVGVTAQRGDKMCVVEYCEIPAALAEATEPGSERLLFGAANICNHYMSVEFLRERVLPAVMDGKSAIYHVAKKRIPFLDENGATATPTNINGIKLELFIFDVFPLAERWLVLEVNREGEFAPVKNEPGNPVDSPDSARVLLSAQGRKWLEAAGAVLFVPDISGDSNDNSDAGEINAGLNLSREPAVFGVLPHENLETIGETNDGDRTTMNSIIEISPMLSYEGEGLDRFCGAIVRVPCYLSDDFGLL